MLTVNINSYVCGIQYWTWLLYKGAEDISEHGKLEDKLEGTHGHGKEGEEIVESLPQDKAVQFDYNVPMKGKYVKLYWLVIWINLFTTMMIY